MTNAIGPADPARPADPAVWKRTDTLHHDREAERYDRLIGREFAVYDGPWTSGRWAARLVADGARVVLDVGSGTGRVALPVAAAGPTVVAADLSRRMLRQARDKASARGLRVLPLVADAERLPFADGALDGVVGSGVLHHLPDVDGAVAEAARVTRAGGWLCFAEPGAEATTVYQAVRWLARRAGALARPLRCLNSPAADHERPLAAGALVATLARHAASVEAAHLTHVPIVYRFAPATLSGWLVRRLNPGDRTAPRPADIVIACGRKA